MHVEHEYQPGDIVNGHRLSADGATWEPVGPPPASDQAAAGNWFVRHKVASGLMAAGAVVVVIAAVAGGNDSSAGSSAQAPGASTDRVQDEPAAEPVEEPAAEPGPEPAPQPDFAPINYSGAGDTVLSVDIPATTASHVMVRITHNGTRNIAVWSLDADLNEVDLLVNDIGAYDGTTILAADAVGLSIEADGAWTVTIEPIAAAATFSDAISGSGDSVVVYTGGKGIATLTHTGERNFAVWAYPESGSDDLMVNEIGTYKGQTIIPGGPAVLVVTADGDWSVTVD